jgi:hypothetical protein
MGSHTGRIKRRESRRRESEGICFTILRAYGYEEVTETLLKDILGKLAHRVRVKLDDVRLRRYPV